MIFRNRQEAGSQLARLLHFWTGRSDVLVLALPHGGVETGFAIARHLDVPLDILLARKLGVPGHEDTAFGAIAPGGFRYIDQSVVQAAGMAPEEIEKSIEQTQESLRRQDRLYRANRAPLDVSGRTVILADDGIATGASIRVAIQALRAMHPARLIVAVPVAPASIIERFRGDVDEFFCLYQPQAVRAVGQFYWDFSPVSDEEVVEILERAAELHRNGGAPGADYVARPAVQGDGFQGGVVLQTATARLEGALSLPASAVGLVLFVHGSSSRRYSPRSRSLAKILQSQRLGTLLFDLLTDEEDLPDQRKAGYRLEIPLLAQRLIDAVEWLTSQSSFRHLPLCYLGSGTGAAAALLAAARRPEQVQAIVSHGGRPDLAGDALSQVQAPTLLVVGNADGVIIERNQQALATLGCAAKKLITVPGATYPFEDLGTLAPVGQHAAEWFLTHLGVAGSVASEGFAQAS